MGNHILYSQSITYHDTIMTIHIHFNLCSYTYLSSLLSTSYVIFFFSYKNISILSKRVCPNRTCIHNCISTNIYIPHRWIEGVLRHLSYSLLASPFGSPRAYSACNSVAYFENASLRRTLKVGVKVLSSMENGSKLMWRRLIVSNLLKLVSVPYPDISGLLTQPDDSSSPLY